MTRYLILAAVLFAIGAYGVVGRRNLLVVLMSLEIMFNAVNLVIVAFARHLAPAGGGADAQGHVFALMVMAVAAAEVATGLAILIALFRNRRSVDTEDYRILRG